MKASFKHVFNDREKGPPWDCAKCNLRVATIGELAAALEQDCKYILELPKVET